MHDVGDFQVQCHDRSCTKGLYLTLSRTCIDHWLRVTVPPEGIYYWHTLSGTDTVGVDCTDVPGGLNDPSPAALNIFMLCAL